jgi:hypothetical protein
MTGATLSTATITFDGEQWRDGGPTAVANVLTFSYLVGTSPSITSVGFTNVASLDFTNPTSTGSAASLDGNASANRTASLSATLTDLAWDNGEQLFLRWSDVDNAGSDHGLGIDNFSFTAVPEPTAVLFGVLVCTLVGLKVVFLRLADEITHARRPEEAAKS